MTDVFDELLADVEPLPLPPPPRPAPVLVPDDEQAAEPQLGFQPTALAVGSKPHHRMRHNPATDQLIMDFVDDHGPIGGHWHARLAAESRGSQTM